MHDPPRSAAHVSPSRGRCSSGRRAGCDPVKAGSIPVRPPVMPGRRGPTSTSNCGFESRRPHLCGRSQTVKALGRNPSSKRAWLPHSGMSNSPARSPRAASFSPRGRTVRRRPPKSSGCRFDSCRGDHAVRSFASPRPRTHSVRRPDCRSGEEGSTPFVGAARSGSTVSTQGVVVATDRPPKPEREGSTPSRPARSPSFTHPGRSFNRENSTLAR